MADFDRFEPPGRELPLPLVAYGRVLELYNTPVNLATSQAKEQGLLDENVPDDENVILEFRGQTLDVELAGATRLKLISLQKEAGFLRLAADLMDGDNPVAFPRLIVNGGKAFPNEMEELYGDGNDIEVIISPELPPIIVSVEDMERIEMATMSAAGEEMSLLRAHDSASQYFGFMQAHNLQPTFLSSKEMSALTAGLASLDMEQIAADNLAYWKEHSQWQQDQYPTIE